MSVRPTAEQCFHNWVARIRDSYAATPDRLREFSTAVEFLIDKAAGYGETGMTARHDGLTYTVSYTSEQSLTIQKIATSETLRGWVRQLHQLKEEFARPEAPNYCRQCSKNHKKYGVEIELRAMTEHTNREMLLRYLNKRQSVDRNRADFGIDGSSDPFELRNINGDSVEDLKAKMATNLTTFQNGLSFFLATFPVNQTEVSIDTKRCGIHVHVFHKGIDRTRYLMAHSLVACLVNSYNMEDWNSRLSSNYGLPMAYRPGSKWCRANHATECRVLNSVMPNVVEFTIKQTDLLLANSFRASATPESEQQLLNQTFPPPMRGQSTEAHLHKVVGYLIHHGVASFGQVKAMKRWLDANYQDFYVRPRSAITSPLNLSTVIQEIRNLRATPTPVTAGNARGERTPSRTPRLRRRSPLSAATSTDRIARPNQSVVANSATGERRAAPASGSRTSPSGTSFSVRGLTPIRCRQEALRNPLVRRTAWCTRIAYAAGTFPGHTFDGVTSPRANLNSHLRNCGRCARVMERQAAETKDLFLEPTGATGTWRLVFAQYEVSF